MNPAIKQSTLFNGILFAFFMSLFIITGCNKDDDNDETDATPSFTATLDWQDGINYVVEETSSLPTSISVTWADDLTQIDSTLIVAEELYDLAFWATNVEEGQMQSVISVNQINGEDTLSLSFIIGEESLQAKRYEIASGDIFTQLIECLFGGCEEVFEFPEGVALPLLSMSQYNDFSLLVLLGLVDYGADDYLEIDSFDSDNRASGSFSIDMKFAKDVVTVDSIAIGNEPILKIENGQFNKVPEAKE